MIVLAAIVASGVGALARHEVAVAIGRRRAATWPWATALVNLLGALVLGVLVGLLASERIGTDPVTVLGTGFCGGFTTFSTWMVDTLRLGTEGSDGGRVAAAVNLAVPLLAGVAGIALATTLAT